MTSSELIYAFQEKWKQKERKKEKGEEVGKVRDHGSIVLIQFPTYNNRQNKPDRRSVST